MPLTAKDVRFIDSYEIHLDPSRAARDAGSSAKRASQAGYEYLKKPDVAKEIARRLEAKSKRAGVDAAWVLTRLTEEAEADIADIYHEDGTLKPIKEWPMVWRRGLVSGIKTSTTGDGAAVIDIKQSDRVKRLELIGKHIGVKAFEETINVKGLEGLGERLARAAERLKGE